MASPSEASPRPGLTPGQAPITTPRRRLLLLSLLRAGLSAALLVLVYYTLPLKGKLDQSAGVGLILGLVGLAVIVVFQVRAILSATYPLLRAIESLATAIPLLLLLFASAYFLMNQADSGSFSQTLNRTAALYFTVTVFSTVGFGDIVPKTDPARIATMLQMLVDLVVLGLVARLIVSAVQVGLQRRSAQPATPGPTRPPSG
jgi:voltage-gated potassium channel